MKIAPLYLVLADRVIRILYGLGAVFMLVNIATPETFGAYSLQLAVFASMSVVANIGLEQVATKYFVQKTFQVGTILFARLIGALPFAVLNYFGLWFFIEEFDPVVAFFLSIAVLLNYNAIIFSYYNAHRELYKQLKNTVLMVVMSGSLKVYALIVADVKIFFLSIVLDSAIPLALFVVFERISASFSDMWLLLSSKRKELLVLCLAAVIVQLNARSDFFILYTVASDSVEVSQYSLALKFAEVFAVAASIILTSITPILFSSQDLEKTSEAFRGYFVKLFALLVFSVLVLYFVGPYFMRLIAGDAYEKSAALAMLIIFSHFFGAIAAFLSAWYVNIGAGVVKLLRSIGLLFLTITLTFILASYYGATGAAVAIVISNFIVGFLMVFIRKDTFKIVFSIK